MSVCVWEYVRVCACVCRESRRKEIDVISSGGAYDPHIKYLRLK
jgi:hypothetical protein